MRYLSVCSGMEAASVAWHPLGWTPVGFSEIEPFPCAILKHRFPNTPNYGSLTEYQSWPLEPGSIDLLVGGTPCQSFSVAGLRKGLADPRGNLALTFLGLADKLKPRWIVWENVPGVLSSGGGRDFGSFLGALVELGYGFAYRVLDAQHFGVPQRRRRVFVVACLGDWRAAAEVLSLREGLRGYLEAGNKKRKGSAADAGAGPAAGCWWDGGQVSQTLDAVLAKGQTMPEKNRFPAVLQPKPVVIDRAAFNQGENAQFEPHIGESEVMDSLVAKGPHAVGVPLPVDFRNNKIFDDPNISGTIQAKSSGGYSLNYTTGILQPIPFRKSKRAASTTDNETWVPADASNTLNNFDLGDTRTTHAVVQPVIPIHDQATRHSGKRGDNQDGKGNGLGIGQPGDPMNTLTQGDKHAVAYCSEVAPTIGASGPPYSRTGNERVEAEALAVTTVMENSRRDAIRIYEGTSPTLQSFMGTGGCNVPMVQPAMAVRRLTPVECERLQGFPDNWSRISWKGKPEEECPDGPRYKACGNSMAVPVMAFIGRQIAAVDSTLPHNA